MAEKGLKGNQTKSRRILELSARIHTNEMLEEAKEVDMVFPFAGRVRARMFVESGVHG